MDSVAYTIQMVSASHHYLKVVSLGQPLGVGKANGMHIPRMGWGGESLMAGVMRTGQLAPCPFDDFTQHNRALGPFL